MWDKEGLENGFSLEEVKAAVFDLARDKAPGF